MTGHLTFVKTYFERAISPPNIKRFWQTPAWPIETIVRDKKNDLAGIVLRSELVSEIADSLLQLQKNGGHDET